MNRTTRDAYRKSFYNGPLRICLPVLEDSRRSGVLTLLINKTHRGFSMYLNECEVLSQVFT